MKSDNGGRMNNLQHPSDVKIGEKRVIGATLSFLAGLFALWVTLTVQGLIDLDRAGGGSIVPLGSRISFAAELAVMLCVIALPLILPWFVAFAAFYFLTPRTSILWRWFVCTLAGMFMGVLALWIDALIISLFTAEPSLSLNLPLLKLASIPASAMGGTACLVAALTVRFFHTASACEPTALPKKCHWEFHFPIGHTPS
jgi:hypothetical protein